MAEDLLCHISLFKLLLCGFFWCWFFFFPFKTKPLNCQAVSDLLRTPESCFLFEGGRTENRCMEYSSPPVSSWVSLQAVCRCFPAAWVSHADEPRKTVSSCALLGQRLSCCFLLINWTFNCFVSPLLQQN